MPDVEFTNLLAVAVVALLAPLTLGLAPALRVPSVVLEIIAGVDRRPSGPRAGSRSTSRSAIVALLGLAFLLFLAGLEIDVHQLRGQAAPARPGRATSSTLVLGVAVGLGLDGRRVDQRSRPDRGHPVGHVAGTGRAGAQGRRPASRAGSARPTVAAASIADFAAIVLLSLLFSTSESSTGSRLVLLGLFAVLVAATAAAVSLGRRRPSGST